MVNKYSQLYIKERKINIKNIHKFAIVTLGCVKNEVDSEMLLAYFSQINLEITDNLEQADMIILNTCGFIQSAKKEAIKYIFDLIDYKTNGSCKLFFVVGCLAKRYKAELKENISEIDEVIGVDEYDKLSNVLKKYFMDKNMPYGIDLSDRIISTKFPSAYVKIAEGCNNRCNYCVIPLIRGELKSRPMEDVLQETVHLVEQGYTEINIIAQDTTNYGLDIYQKASLDKLLSEMSKIDGIKWIRILYMYPGKVTDDLIKVIKENDNICKYFDIPIQHIADNVLKSMNRHCTSKDIYELIKKIRRQIPEAIIRTTVMVGHPQESEQDYQQLLKTIEEVQFDRLGAFMYSPEEDTISCSMEQISQRIKKIRYRQVMELQQQVVLKKMQQMLGRELEVLIYDVTANGKYYISRSYMDAPDVDPKIYIPITDKNSDKIIIGGYSKVILEKISGYDYIADLKEKNDDWKKEI